MFAILFRALAKPGKRQELLDFLKEDCQCCKDLEPRTLNFDILQDPENENAFYVYEAYEDCAAFDEHTKNDPYINWDDHVKDELVAVSRDLFKGEPLCSPRPRATMSFCGEITSGEPDKKHSCGKAFKKELDPEDIPSMHATCVMFVDGAYTKWHYHTGEQMLFAIQGQGFVERQHEPRLEISEGTHAYIPAGVWHRHGAVEGKTLAHLAVTSGETKWDEEDPCQKDPTYGNHLGLGILNEIASLDQRILQAEEAGSVEEMAPVLAEGFTIVRASGEKMDRQAFLNAIPANSNRGRSESQSKVHLVGECAVYTCVVTTTQPNPGRFWNTRLFISENRQWLCAEWRVLRIPD